MYTKIIDKKRIDILNCLKKLKISINFMYSISYFEDAENDILPKTFVAYSWIEIKKFFLLLQKEIKKALFKQKGL